MVLIQSLRFLTNSQSSGEVIDFQVLLRGDEAVSVQCQLDLQNWRVDLWVVSASAFQNYRRLVTDRMQRDGLQVRVNGTSNPVYESHRQLQAWAVDAWRHGATGLVPWQTVDKSGKVLRKADQLGCSSSI